jgi:hypothetical protein
MAVLVWRLPLREGRESSWGCFNLPVNQTQSTLVSQNCQQVVSFLLTGSDRGGCRPPGGGQRSHAFYAATESSATSALLRPARIALSDRTGFIHSSAPTNATARSDNSIRGNWGRTGVHGRVAPLARLHHRLKPPTRRSDAGPEPSQPRSAISSPSHNSQRSGGPGRAICWLCTELISRRWQSETKPRTWASFVKQCHSPPALRQNSFSVSPSGVSSIGPEYI